MLSEPGCSRQTWPAFRSGRIFGMLPWKRTTAGDGSWSGGGGGEGLLGGLREGWRGVRGALSAVWDTLTARARAAPSGGRVSPTAGGCGSGYDRMAPSPAGDPDQGQGDAPGWIQNPAPDGYPANTSVLEGPRVDLPQPGTVHGILEDAISREPARARATGLLSDDHFLSYTDLNRRANALARGLHRRLNQLTSRGAGSGGAGSGGAGSGGAGSSGAGSGGAGSGGVGFRGTRPPGCPSPVIAVDMEPGPDQLAVVLAVFKLGAAYMPVDAHSAINRVRYTLNEASPVCIVVDAASAFTKDADTVWSSFRILQAGELQQAERPEGLLHTVGLDSETMVARPLVASVIYTSGSSGRPKGVMLSHRAIINRLAWQWETFPLRPTDIGCFKTSVLFVDSLVEMLSCVVRLVSLTIVSRAATADPRVLIPVLQRHGVTRLTAVPSLLRNLLSYLSLESSQSPLPALTLWINNSEAPRLSLVDQFYEVFPSGRTLCNFYGSTETMADVTYEVFEGREHVAAMVVEGNLSIGRPIWNSRVYVVDDSMELLSKGDPGQICVSGYNVADGYLDDQLVDGAFMPNPFSSDPRHRVLYRTGDIGRVVGGRLFFEGRRDSQIKVRGQRVNTTEVERVVSGCRGVEKAVVQCQTFGDTSAVIVAYYTTGAGADRHLEAEIAGACQRGLPSYMRPKLVRVDEIPLQIHTGKVDRQALRRLYEKSFNRQSSLELSVLDEKCRKALNIIALSLNLPSGAICGRKSFMELGGDSVSLVSALVQLHQYGLHIPLSAFSGSRSVQDVVDHVVQLRHSPPLGHTLHTDRYEVRMLSELGADDAIVGVLADSFVDKEPLHVLLGVTRDEILPFAWSLYREACARRPRDLSLVVLDRASGHVVGGDFLFEMVPGVRVEHHPSMSPILGLLTQFESPIKNDLLRRGPQPLVYNFCLCVHKDLPHTDQVKICHLIEGRVLLVAKQHGYRGVLTNNTNPVTQNICEYYYNYEVLSTLLVRDFEYDGRRVFAHAPEDYHIKMMVKYVQRQRDTRSETSPL